MNNQLVIVLDFGGQYNQLIARRVRECNVYCEVMPYTKSLEELKAKNPSAIIFTGRSEQRLRGRFSALYKRDFLARRADFGHLLRLSAYRASS